MKILDNLKKAFIKPVHKIKKASSSEEKEIRKLEDKLNELQEREENAEKSIAWGTKMIFKFWFVGLIAIFVGYLLYQSLNFIYLIVGAYIISIAMEALIDFFRKIKLNQGFSIGLAYLILVIFVFSGFFFIVPFLLNQVSEMINIFIGHIADIQALLQNQTLSEIVYDVNWLPVYIKESLLQSIGDPKLMGSIQQKLQENISNIVNLGTNYAQAVGSFTVNFLGGFFSSLINAAILITLSVLFSAEKKPVMKFVASLGGEKKYQYIYLKLEKIYKKLGIWLKSRLLLSLLVGLAVYASLWIIAALGRNLPSKGSIAVILGLLDIVPYIGPFLGGIPLVLVAWIHIGFWAGIVMMGLVFMTNFLENNVLVPVLMNKTLGINPVLIFVSMLLGGLIMGFIGVILAVPIAVIITIAYDKHFEMKDE